jgi:hypothetical protein
MGLLLFDSTNAHFALDTSIGACLSRTCRNVSTLFPLSFVEFVEFVEESRF